MSDHPMSYDSRETKAGRARWRAKCACSWISEWAKSLGDAGDLADEHRREVGLAV